MLDRTGRPSTWHAEYVEFLKQLFSAGKSTRQAAELLNNHFGTSYTRLAVIGKAWRSGLNIPMPQPNDPRRRHTPKPRTFRPPKPKRPTEAPPIQDIVDLEIPMAQRKTIETIEMNQCRWPVGEPGTEDFFFCGAEIASHSRSYCAAHHRRAHTGAKVGNHNTARGKGIAKTHVSFRGSAFTAAWQNQDQRSSKAAPERVDGAGSGSGHSDADAWLSTG